MCKWFLSCVLIVMQDNVSGQTFYKYSWFCRNTDTISWLSATVSFRVSLDETSFHRLWIRLDTFGSWSEWNWFTTLTWMCNLVNLIFIFCFSNQLIMITVRINKGFCNYPGQWLSGILKTNEALISMRTDMKSVHFFTIVNDILMIKWCIANDLFIQTWNWKPTVYISWWFRGSKLVTSLG